jgi:hypothetical protein
LVAASGLDEPSGLSSKDSTRQYPLDASLLSCDAVPLFEVMAVRQTSPRRGCWCSLDSDRPRPLLLGWFGVAVDSAACVRGCSRHNKEIAA